MSEGSPRAPYEELLEKVKAFKASGKTKEEALQYILNHAYWTEYEIRKAVNSVYGE